MQAAQQQSPQQGAKIRTRAKLFARAMQKLGGRFRGGVKFNTLPPETSGVSRAADGSVVLDMPQVLANAAVTSVRQARDWIRDRAGGGESTGTTPSAPSSSPSAAPASTQAPASSSSGAAPASAPVSTPSGSTSRTDDNWLWPPRHYVMADPFLVLPIARSLYTAARELGNFAKWSVKATKQLGNWIKPHLKDLWKAAQKSAEALAQKLDDIMAAENFARKKGRYWEGEPKRNDPVANRGDSPRKWSDKSESQLARDDKKLTPKQRHQHIADIYDHAPSRVRRLVTGSTGATRTRTPRRASAPPSARPSSKNSAKIRSSSTDSDGRRTG